MPDKPLTVLTYAASASLAAVALVYFFNPNYLIDGEASTSSAKTRKKGIVGLFNPANDCFINCILQSLAGLGDLRLYLIREVHRRELGGEAVYAAVPLVDGNGKNVNTRKLASLQSGVVTQGLKDMIDRLNERPIRKKTISAANFIKVLEYAFETRIAKSQQDAQELLQLVAERLSEEYHAGQEARNRAQKLIEKVGSTDSTELRIIDESKSEDLDIHADSGAKISKTPVPNDEIAGKDGTIEDEHGFPLDGQTEARTECQYCHFVPKASPTTFVMLNLMVPQKSSSTLNDCFDAHFKTEYIEDYKCDKCRLEHAVQVFSNHLSRAKSDKQRTAVQADIEKLQKALQDDPEKVPEDVTLPDSRMAPKRRIARHIEITTFPKVLVIHLSRSIFDPRSTSTKNTSKLSFPEKFPVGGILKRRNYKLLGMVTHKGTHNNGHYESFRRQHLYAPFSTPHVDKASGPYSATTSPKPSMAANPETSNSPESSNNSRIPASSHGAAEISSLSIGSSSPSSSSNAVSSPSTRPSSGSTFGATEAEAPEITASYNPSSLINPEAEDLAANQIFKPSASTSKGASVLDTGRFKRKKKPVDRWWRISDDKIKECKLSDVLSMQKEVYMLFYEMERDLVEEGG